MPLPPVPGSPTRGWLVLIGGGEFSFGETEEIDRFMLGKMPTEKRSIAFIPAASGSNEYAVHLDAHYRKLNAMVKVRNIPIYRMRDARRAKNLALLRDAGMVYIGGGVTNSLLDASRDTPLAEVLGEVLDGGGVVAGIGAGASALGTWAPDMHRPANAIRGMALIPGSAIVTAFDPSDDEMLRRMMSLEDVRVGYGIPPGVALAVAPDRAATIVGNGSIAVVRKP
ncbi:MAG: Type 1 glutamine amidotransferase-like domain-containing protein [Thermoanaerobaculia bacterium]